MLFLLALLILGIVWVASALIDNDAASMESLYGTVFRMLSIFLRNKFDDIQTTLFASGRAFAVKFYILLMTVHYL